MPNGTSLHILFNIYKLKIMKKITLFIVAILIAGYTFSQTVSPELISSSGDYYYNETTGYSISWSIGEPMTASYNQAEGSVTEGFHAIESLLTIVEVVKIFNENNIIIYPNPTAELINVEYPDLKSNTKIEIYNMQGKLMISQKITSTNEQINLSKLASSTYIVKIIEDNIELRTFKIQKIK